MEKEGYYLLIPLCLNAMTAIFLFLRGKQAYQRINKAFATWIICVCFWDLQFITQTINASDNLLKFLFRFSFLGEWITPSVFLYFVYCFTHEKLNKRKYVLLILPPILFVVLIIMDMFGFKVVISTIRYNAYGSTGRSVVFIIHTFLAWLLYFAIYSLWGASLLIAHLWRTTIAIRMRSIQHLILQSNFLLAVIGVLIFILGLTFDIIAPIFGLRIFQFSSITTLIMVALMGWLLYRVERE